ncbi:hypothetical protein [Hyphomonas oceanitis]|uniref:hypothetical protein n=1 Tax=Hyphomonas oceanitis TaxID=81033 RepID=UPI003002044F
MFKLFGKSNKEPSSRDKEGRFWSWFTENEGKLRELYSADPRSVSSAGLFKELQKVAAELAYELGRQESGKFELIISADGAYKIFPIVFSLVASSPKIDGWIITALRPPIGFDMTYSDDHISLCLGDAAFTVLGAKDHHAVKLLIHIDDADMAKSEKYTRACWILLDAGLGEWVSSQCIADIEVMSSAPDPANTHTATEVDQICRGRMADAGLGDPYAAVN